MRAAALVLALIAVTAGCGGAAEPQRRDPAVCTRLFVNYDNALWLYPNSPWGENQPLLPGDVSRAAQALIRGGCLTRSQDLDGMPALAQRLAAFSITDSGPAITPATVELGIVTGIWDEGRVTVFFRGLGYRSRGQGALTLGRRIFIGPFISQGGLDQALAVAREAGFIAPHVAPHTRF